MIDKQLGSNRISKEELSSSYFFTNSTSTHDVTCIIGKKKINDSNGVLLLMRFNKYIVKFSKRSKQTGSKLLLELINSLKNNGLERRRLGGSSGIVQCNHNFHLLMKTHNSSPRFSKGENLFTSSIMQVIYIYNM